MSAVSVCLVNGGGAVGIGCVGQACSPTAIRYTAPFEIEATQTGVPAPAPGLAGCTYSYIGAGGRCSYVHLLDARTARLEAVRQIRGAIPPLGDPRVAAPALDEGPDHHGDGQEDRPGGRRQHHVPDHQQQRGLHVVAPGPVPFTLDDGHEVAAVVHAGQIVVRGQHRPRRRITGLHEPIEVESRLLLVVRGVGQEVELTLLRSGAERTVRVELEPGT